MIIQCIVISYLIDALITAQKVLADKDVKQSEVDKALSDLLNAYSNLKSSAPYAGLKAELDLAKIF